ncbi:aado/keto reductase [Exidia glandulosa HHB12029]|uniref:Aado/keto reductase n=1 Tax=Exidia glandulosa HHB12029 TaxID=1314781 RepID=A0A165LNL5_EXIGL|nr:aado/keto reductase [Exidia glandulosa HHB12029]
MGESGHADRTERMCRKATEIGYRAFDTAMGYGNEEAVGRAIEASGIPRQEIFVTTKFGKNHHHRVGEAVDESLKALGTDYIDLYLMHWPMARYNGRTVQPDEYPTIIDAWKDMEAAFFAGKVRAIGVSNFDKTKIQRIIDECRVVPAVNQIELHPCLPQKELLGFCRSKGIQVTAYSSLGQPGGKIIDGSSVLGGGGYDAFSQDETVNAIAAKHGATMAQVLLSWAVQQGVNVIPKTENEERMRSNLSPITFDAEDVGALDAFHKRPGMHRSLLSYHSIEDVIGVFGWSYEQLGWSMVKGGIVPQ